MRCCTVLQGDAAWGSVTRLRCGTGSCISCRTFCHLCRGPGAGDAWARVFSDLAEFFLAKGVPIKPKLDGITNHFFLCCQPRRRRASYSCPNTHVCDNELWACDYARCMGATRQQVILKLPIWSLKPIMSLGGPAAFQEMAHLQCLVNLRPCQVCDASTFFFVTRHLLFMQTPFPVLT